MVERAWFKLLRSVAVVMTMVSLTHAASAQEAAPSVAAPENLPPPPPAAPPTPPAAAPPPPASPPPVGPMAAPPPPRPYAYEYGHYRHPRRPRRSKGLLISGIVLFGVSYMVPAIIGAAVGSLDRSTCDCQDAFRMFIPIAGPITLIKRDRDYAPLNALLITDTVLQSAGLALTIIGIIRYAASGSNEPEFAATPPSTPQLSFDASPTLGGAYASLRLRL